MILQQKRKGGNFINNFFFLLSLLLCLLLCTFLFLLFFEIILSLYLLLSLLQRTQCSYQAPGKTQLSLAKLPMVVSSTDYCSQENFRTAWPTPRRCSSLFCFTKGLETPDGRTVECSLLYSLVQKKILAPCFMGSPLFFPVRVYSQWPRR